MKELPTTLGLTVLAILAIVSISARAVFGQAPKSVETKPLIDDITAAKVDKLFAQWDKPDSPGCALGIIKDGRFIYKRGYGMANIEHNVPLSTRSVFNVMSITKQFTAVGILLLAKQRKLTLDDEIQKHLPELPRYQSPVTIRHLIHHTSGVRNFFVLMEWAGMRWNNVRLTDDDFLELLARQKDLNHKPGEEFLYSNTNYFLLSQIIQKVSGKSLREFADESIFKPLGMNDTLFLDDRTLMVKNRATGYSPKSTGGFSLGLIVDSSGASGLYTSVDDLFLWDQNFYNNKLGGGPDLINDALSTRPLNSGEKLEYAFGLVVGEYKGLKTSSHAGTGDGFGHELTRFPEQRFTVIRLCNAGNVNTYGSAAQLADIFLADQFKKSTDAVKQSVTASPDIVIHEKELTGLAGTYFDPITSGYHRYYMNDGKLMIDPDFRMGNDFVLSHLGQNRFKVVGGGPPGLEIVFQRPVTAGNLQVKHITGSKTQTWEAVRSFTPTPAQLADFSGKYASDELPGAVYTLSIKDEKLILHVRSGIAALRSRASEAERAAGASKDTEDNLLTPAFADAFLTFGGSALLRFTRNQQNVVSGFTLTNRLARRLRFNKQ